MLDKRKLDLIIYSMLLSIFMLIIRRIVSWVPFPSWELGMGGMGIFLLMLITSKDKRWDKVYISAFLFCFGMFLGDLDSFVVVLFGGDIIG